MSRFFTKPFETIYPPNTGLTSGCFIGNNTATSGFNALANSMEMPLLPFAVPTPLAGHQSIYDGTRFHSVNFGGPVIFLTAYMEKDIDTATCLPTPGSQPKFLLFDWNLNFIGMRDKVKLCDWVRSTAKVELQMDHWMSTSFFPNSPAAISSREWYFDLRSRFFAGGEGDPILDEHRISDMLWTYDWWASVDNYGSNGTTSLQGSDKQYTGPQIMHEITQFGNVGYTNVYGNNVSNTLRGENWGDGNAPYVGTSKRGGMFLVEEAEGREEDKRKQYIYYPKEEQKPGEIVDPNNPKDTSGKQEIDKIGCQPRPLTAENTFHIEGGVASAWASSIRPVVENPAMLLGDGCGVAPVESSKDDTLLMFFAATLQNPTASGEGFDFYIAYFSSQRGFYTRNITNFESRTFYQDGPRMLRVEVQPMYSDKTYPSGWYYYIKDEDLGNEDPVLQIMPIGPELRLVGMNRDGYFKTLPTRGYDDQRHDWIIAGANRRSVIDIGLCYP